MSPRQAAVLLAGGGVCGRERVPEGEREREVGEGQEAGSSWRACGPLGVCPHCVCVPPGPCARTPAAGAAATSARVCSGARSGVEPTPNSCPPGLLPGQGRAQSSWPQSLLATRPPRPAPAPDRRGGSGLPGPGRTRAWRRASFPPQGSRRKRGRSRRDGQGAVPRPLGPAVPLACRPLPAGQPPRSGFLCPTTTRRARARALGTRTELPLDQLCGPGPPAPRPAAKAAGRPSLTRPAPRVPRLHSGLLAPEHSATGAEGEPGGVFEWVGASRSRRVLGGKLGWDLAGGGRRELQPDPRATQRTEAPACSAPPPPPRQLNRLCTFSSESRHRVR